MEIQKKKLSIVPIDGLRFILALNIVLCHMEFSNYTSGKMTLVAFFVMSGFFMEMHHACSKINLKQWLRLEVGTFSKIYPLHWLCLLAWMAFPAFKVTAHIIPSIFLLQCWIPDNSIVFYGNGMSWFISTLAFSYVVFPLLSCGSRKLGRALKWGLMLALLALMACLNVWMEDNYFRQIFPPARVVDFLLGVLLYQLVTDVSEKPEVRRFVSAYAPAMEAVVVVACAAAYVWLGINYAVPVGWVIISAVLLLATLGEIYGVRGPVFRLLSQRWLVWLGGISFEIYLIQQLVFAVMKSVKNVLHLEFRSPLYLCMEFGMLIVGAIVLHYCFVKPVSRFITRSVNKKLTD
ncbi:MAG: acyltransferase [Bacteroidales bacterium]|nr:acyltransferase [Bacteroidales bacterium]